MESKNVKVIDEHSIDRNANIICGFDVDGSNYVFYWIERDADNDNLFVSKLTKNNDGTSNMVNIDDSMEKNRVSDVVKELVTYSINNDGENLSTNNVSLSNNRVVNIFSVLFNKEQNINVQKTYITTVKKTVTRVSEKFYNVSKPVNADSVGITVQPVAVEAPTVDPIAPIVNEVIPEVTPKIEVPIQTEVNSVESFPSVNEVKTEAMPQPDIIKEAIAEVQPVSTVPTSEVVVEHIEPTVKTVVEGPTVAAIQSSSIENSVANSDISNATPEATKIVEPVVEPVTPVQTVAAPVMPMAQEPSVTVSEAPAEFQTAKADDTLFFDASKESNLNVALGEISAEKAVPVNDVTPIREFGQEEPTNVTPLAQNFEGVENTASEVDTAKAGFANNKFFMVIAIAFFLASCVFLGYEVFQYFQLQA